MNATGDEFSFLNSVLNKSGLAEDVVAAIKSYDEACRAYDNGDLITAKKLFANARALLARYGTARQKLDGFTLSAEDRFVLSRL